MENITATTSASLQVLEKSISRLIEKKRKTDLCIVDLEARIHAIENISLKQLHNYGTIVKSLDGYLTQSTTTTTNATRREGTESEECKYVSKTSASYARALAIHSRLVKEGSLEVIKLPNTTFSSSSTNGNGGRKRSRHS
jgi:hypothetical protein